MHFESGKWLELGTFARTRRGTAGSAGGRGGSCLWSLRRFASLRTAEGRATSFNHEWLWNPLANTQTDHASRSICEVPQLQKVSSARFENRSTQPLRVCVSPYHQTQGS